MKSKLWLFQIPIVAFFAWTYWIHEAGTHGKLRNAFLREAVFPKLVTIAGQHTNLKFHLRGHQPPKNKIVVVDIDNDSVDAYGRWPWHRDRTAQLIQSVLEAGAKYVALDITFSEADKRVSPELAKFLKEKNLGVDIGSFETDHNLETVVAFNEGKISLGWMGASDCQPLYKAEITARCPIDIAKGNQTTLSMAKFAIQDVKLSRELNLRQVPFRFVPAVINNLPMYNAVSDTAGYLNIVPDPDGYIRRTNLIVAGPDGRLYPSLALATASAILKERITLELDERQAVKSLHFSPSGREIAVSPLGLMEINFRGPAATFQYVKAVQVMSEDDGILIEEDGAVVSASKKELLKDSIVFIGVTAVGAFEMRSFPFDSNQPGVEGHANILDNLLSGDMLSHGQVSSKGGETSMYLVMTLGALFFAFLIATLESIPALLVFLFSMCVGFFVDLVLLFNANSNWNTSILLIEITAIFILTFAVKYILEEKNKKFIRGAFAKYVSPTIIDSIMKDPSKLQVGGEKRDLTIVFSDIRSFTSFSEKMDARELATFLNDYLGRMTDIVFETEGTLDKYIGDAVMAFWGAPLDQPKHAANACRAAIKMQQTLRKERPYFKEKYDVDVYVGIGVNSGPVSVGNMGSERIFEYTVIGDHVNLASRLEGLTKDYHSAILTTRFTLDLIKQSGEPIPTHRVLDFVKVKGKQIAVEIIQILDVEFSKENIAIFNEARALYAAQKWDEAITLFTLTTKTLADGEKEDLMSHEFIKRCQNFKLTPPPADWDGAWVMTTK